MERASKLIQSLKLPSETITAEELACAAWPHAVGNKIATHTRAVRMVRGRLVVEVEDGVWQRQLFTLTRQILVNLEKNLGPGIIQDLEFRIVPRRRGPQRAAEAMPATQDEAANIADPVLRSIYKASRLKAQA
jgi:predicted nucleic acid-binding Zn ribbon protein